MFCIIDEFSKNFNPELDKNLFLPSFDGTGGRCRNRKDQNVGKCKKANLKNRLMLMWDKIMLRKRYITECVNELLKNKANLVHSRYRSVHNFIMNLCSALTAYCFFENKPQALPVHVEKTKQLELFF
ncbi:hypothetical protein EII32_09345 [Prevotella sp. OH937_COT-195]|nr:hypothetical protein EII32_09345 [Prevotella sp. OH937_COT-195]